MLRGSRGKNVTRTLKIADKSQMTEAPPAFYAGHPTKGHMRQAAYGVKDKISMQGKRAPRISEGLA